MCTGIRCYLREGKVRIICELARKIFERAWEHGKLAKRVSHRLRKDKMPAFVKKKLRNLFVFTIVNGEAFG